jgi:glucan phosphorylase
MPDEAMIAYLSMEIGADSQLPTCCGGLSVLAGDLIKGSAEIDFPLVGVSLRHHSARAKFPLLFVRSISQRSSER